MRNDAVIIQTIVLLRGTRRFTLVDRDVIRGIDLDERRHGYLEQFVLVGARHLNGSSFSAETDLAVAAFDLKHVYKHVLIDSLVLRQDSGVRRRAER